MNDVTRNVRARPRRQPSAGLAADAAADRLQLHAHLALRRMDRDRRNVHLAVIWPRYWYGLLRARLGRSDILDRVLEANARFAGWVAQELWTRVLLAITGIRLRVRELIPIDWSRTHVVCANHASLFDIFALIRIVPPPFRFVAKRELVRWPVFGWTLRPAGQIIVDRADHTGALRSIAEAAVRNVRGQVVFFVEGPARSPASCRSSRRARSTSRSNNRLPVLPTAIRGSFAALAKRPWWRLQPGNEIEVLFCPPIPPPRRPRAAVEELRAQTRGHRDALAGITDDCL